MMTDIFKLSKRNLSPTASRLCLAAVLFSCQALVSPVLAKDHQPRLILQITVDALRGDLPGRYSNVLGEGGFRYLMDEGVNYTNAHYQHANTETIVGHVSSRMRITIF